MLEGGERWHCLYLLSLIRMYQSCTKRLLWGEIRANNGGGILTSISGRKAGAMKFGHREPAWKNPKSTNPHCRR